jgi:hypothetical protein
VCVRVCVCARACMCVCVCVFVFGEFIEFIDREGSETLRVKLHVMKVSKYIRTYTYTHTSVRTNARVHTHTRAHNFMSHI